ncbi:hypothetical protein Tco_0998621 [Tanacetum coccineum]
MQSQPGSSVWQRQMPAQSATQYWQPDTSSQPGSYYLFGRNIPNREKREQFPSKYKLTPFMEQPPTTILPKQRVNKTKNKGKKANLSPLNLGGAFEDDNVEENNVTFLGSQFTGNFLMYENVDPAKVRRGNYVNLPAFLNDPHQIYLDCYMKGYIVPVSFWQQLVPHFCMPDMHRLPHGTPIGWLSGEEDRVRQLAMMNLSHEFNDASTAKDELGKAYEKCRDIPHEQHDLIKKNLKTEAELDYQMNNALLLKAERFKKDKKKQNQSKTDKKRKRQEKRVKMGSQIKSRISPMQEEGVNEAQNKSQRANLEALSQRDRSCQM